MEISLNNASRQGHRPRGVITLLCHNFFPATYEEATLANIICCKDCHRDNYSLIAIRPRKDNSNQTDFSLPIEALVCCRVYDLARAKNNSWWLKECMIRGHSRMSGFRDDDAPLRPKIKPKSREADEEESGYAEWLHRRR